MPQTEKRYPRRGSTKSAKGKRVIHEGTRRTRKGHEGVGGSSRGVCQGSPRGERISRKRQKDRRREKGFHEGVGEGGVCQGPPRGERISRKRQKDIHEGPRRTAKGHEGFERDPGERLPKGQRDERRGTKGQKEKGHEGREGPTKGLEEAREGSAMGQGEKGFPGGKKDFHEGQKDIHEDGTAKGH